jgi:hypothetical protein
MGLHHAPQFAEMRAAAFASNERVAKPLLQFLRIARDNAGCDTLRRSAALVKFRSSATSGFDASP